jgi:hypothetical protein
MKIFHCACDAAVFFDNTSCLNCKRELGYLPDRKTMSAIEPAGGEGEYKALAVTGKQATSVRKCQNYAKENVCNWMVPTGEDASPFCVACRLTRTIPSLDQPAHREYWANIEAAKRRLVYSLLELGLPLRSKDDDKRGLAFDFLANPKVADEPQGEGTPAKKVMTGHADGIITLDIAEADEIAREQVRMRLHESYRTLLGHFRHESGHYYWQLLISNTKWIEPFRKLFGDERLDYQKALADHYAEKGPSDWQSRFISQYASSHPWEDWAETWAHHLHMVDSLETSREFGIGAGERARNLVDPRLFTTSKSSGPAVRSSFAKVLREWVWLSLAMNAMNRSMGMRDAYPFVLNEPVAQKLEFVDDVVRQARAG